MATTVSISVDEYLSTSFRPDREYVDGELREKPMVSPLHGRVQLLLAVWFEMHAAEWNIQTMVEARTRTRRDRVRLPDVVVAKAGKLPRKVLSEPPLVAIESLSETYTFNELRARAADLWAMGVRDLWLLDSDAKAAWVWSGREWLLSSDSTFTAKSEPLFLDLNWLWSKLEPS